MTQLQLITDLAQVGVGLLFWSSATFPFVISIVWPWWQSWWGRNIVCLEIAIASALLPSELHRSFGLNVNTYLYGWIAVGALFCAAFIVLWRMVLIYKIQWRNRSRTTGQQEEQGGV